MRLRYIFTPLFIIVIGFIIYQFYQLPKDEQAKTVSKVEDILNQKVSFDKGNIAVRKADKVAIDKIADKKDLLKQKTRQQLKSIFDAINEISMLDQQALEPHRRKLMLLAAEDPQGFRQYILDLAKSVESTKTETTFFFVEAFVKSDEAPGKSISEILNLKAGEEKEGRTGKTNLLKAFTLENMFERHAQGPEYKEDPLPVVEVDLVRLVKNDKNLNLVRESLLLLQDHYKYSKEQLRILVYARPEQDGYAFEDIIN